MILPYLPLPPFLRNVQADNFGKYSHLFKKDDETKAKQFDQDAIDFEEMVIVTDLGMYVPSIDSSGVSESSYN